MRYDSGAGSRLPSSPSRTPRLAAAARLHELTLSAQELRVEAGLAIGEAPDLIGRLQSLVREHPLRERFWEQLMTALVDDGRQADALRAFQQARATLIDGTGLGPGPALRGLEARALTATRCLPGTAVMAALVRAGGDGHRVASTADATSVSTAQALSRNGIVAGSASGWAGADATGRRTPASMPRRRCHHDRLGAGGPGATSGVVAASARPSASSASRSAEDSSGTLTAPVHTSSCHVLTTNWRPSGCQCRAEVEPVGTAVGDEDPTAPTGPLRHAPSMPRHALHVERDEVFTLKS